MRTGFGAHQQAQGRADADFQRGGFIPYLRLKDDGDIAKIRVVSEHEEDAAKEAGVHSTMRSAAFHNVEERSQQGKAWFHDVLCTLEEDEDTSELSGGCTLCAMENRRTQKFMAWVWVYGIYHRAQSPDPKVRWEQGNLGRQLVYKEPMDKFMVWQDGYFMSQLLEGRLARYGRLTDRDYLITRHGMKNTRKVTRDLDAMEPSVIPPDILDLSKNLPDLMAIASGEVTSMDGAGPSEGGTGESFGEVVLPQFDGAAVAAAQPPADETFERAVVEADGIHEPDGVQALDLGDDELPF